MSETLGVVIMMNNYFHDVATALLMGSGVALLMMLRHHELGASEASDQLFLRLHRSMSRLAKLAVIWIVLGGIPRTIYYERFEWSHWAGKSQVPALMVKHVLFFLLLGAGSYLWWNLSQRAKAIRQGRPAASTKA